MVRLNRWAVTIEMGQGRRGALARALSGVIVHHRQVSHRHALRPRTPATISTVACRRGRAVDGVHWVRTGAAHWALGSVCPSSRSSGEGFPPAAAMPPADVVRRRRRRRLAEQECEGACVHARLVLCSAVSPSVRPPVVRHQVAAAAAVDADAAPLSVCGAACN